MPVVILAKGKYHRAMFYRAKHSMDPESGQGMTEKRSGGCLRSLLEFIGVIVVAALLAWGITTFVVQPYEIPSGSMEDTIEVGDRVLSEKVSYYLGEPKAGDIVTFTAYEDPLTSDLYAQKGDAPESVQGRLEEKVLIKRVIATGGQTVSLESGLVYVDGRPLDEPYTDGKPSEPLSDSDLTFPYTVPEGEVWVMGDNRTNSKDSRFFGSVPVESVTGHAFVRYWPLERIGGLG